MASPDAHQQRLDTPMSAKESNDEVPMKMYPPILFQFSPTCTNWARLTAKDIHSLVQPPEMIG